MNRMFRRIGVIAALSVGVAAQAMAQHAIRVVKDEGPVRISAPASTQYPDELRRRGVEGTVIVEAKIDSTGRADIASMRVIESADPRFDQAAKEFVARSRYRPGRSEGRRVSMYIRVPVRFDLHGLGR